MELDRAQIRKKKRLIRKAVRKALCFMAAVMVLMTLPAVAIAESDVPAREIMTPVMKAAPAQSAAPVTQAADIVTQGIAPVPETIDTIVQSPPTVLETTDTLTQDASLFIEDVTAPFQVQPAKPSQPAATSVYKVKAKADGRSHVKINWSKVKGATGYSVYRSTKPGKLGKRIYTTEKAKKKSWKDESPVIDKTYYYTVKAWKKATGKKITIATIHAKKVKNALKYKKSFEVKTVAYSGGGTTASGKKARVGLVAVDPNVIALGTWLYVEGYGLCQAADTGGAIKGKKIDLYMNHESECYTWGVRYKHVYILK
jgi:3D (Asp-Asp-Asp) domain-containing protein